MLHGVILRQTIPWAIIYDHIQRRHIITNQSNYKIDLQFRVLELFFQKIWSWVKSVR